MGKSKKESKKEVKRKESLDSPRLGGGRSESEDRKSEYKSEAEDLDNDSDMERDLEHNSKSRKHKKKDEKDKALDKLSGINSRLKRRLREINIVVEKALDKKQRNDAKLLWNKSRKSVDPGHRMQIKEQEIENSEVQKKMYLAEIERLKNKIEKFAGVNKLMEKEDVKEELRAEIKEKKVEIHKLKHM